MLKTIGFIFVVVAIGAGFLYFGGYIGGSASVNLTPKAKQAIINSLDTANNTAKEQLNK